MSASETVGKTEARLERLENHYDSLKRTNERIEKKVDDISDALLGTAFGDIGIVERFKIFKAELDSIKEEQIKNKIYLSWFIKIYTIILGATVVILLKYIFKGL
jgi:hypothetical protein